MIEETQHYINVIEAGAADEDLDILQEAINERRQAVLGKQRGDLQVGDIVVLGNGISPKYLTGEVMRVVKFNKTTVTCKWIEGRKPAKFEYDKRAEARWSNPKGVRVPLSLIADVEKAA